MKRLLFALLVSISFFLKAGEISFSVVVLDERSSRPVPNTSVLATFTDIPNFWGGESVTREIRKMTDKSGRCSFTGTSNNARSTYKVEGSSGYYAPQFRRFVSTGMSSGVLSRRYEPYGIVYTSIMQRVESPIPLFVKRVEWRNWRQGLLGLQGTNAVLRLDMFKGDWLPPYGHGETADLEIASELRITGKERRFSFSSRTESDVFFYDLVQTIRPTGADDCISESMRDPRFGIKIRRGGDDGRGVHIVRQQGDRKQFSQGGEWHSKRFDDTDDNRCYTFRIRSKYDEKGDLVEAYYGKVYGDFKFEGDLERGIISVRFLYYLNPTPLDRNLEWDMKTNLCPNPDLANAPQP